MAASGSEEACRAVGRDGDLVAAAEALPDRGVAAGQHPGEAVAQGGAAGRVAVQGRGGGQERRRAARRPAARSGGTAISWPPPRPCRIAGAPAAWKASQGGVVGAQEGRPDRARGLGPDEVEPLALAAALAVGRATCRIRPSTTTIPSPAPVRRCFAPSTSSPRSRRSDDACGAQARRVGDPDVAGGGGEGLIDEAGLEAGGEGRERLIVEDSRLGFHAPYEPGAFGSMVQVDSTEE
jgi:hypothetical protein